MDQVNKCAICLLQNNLNVSDNGEIYIKFLKNEHGDLISSNFKGFSSYNKKIQRFPVNLHEFLPNLEDITIFQENLKEIRPKDLENFKNLLRLQISSNEIKKNWRKIIQQQ